MASVAKKVATNEDVLNAPEHKVAEIIHGSLILSPRPAPRHTRAASRHGSVLGGPFDMGTNGPGGWARAKPFDLIELDLAALWAR